MRIVSTVALAIAVVLASTPAQARHEWSPIGGAGDTSASPECPPHEVMVGVTGRTGAYIDQIQIICAPMLANGGHGATHAYRDVYGGFGGAPAAAAVCPDNSRISSIHAALTWDNRMVAGLTMNCVDGGGRWVSRLSFKGNPGDSVGSGDSWKTRHQAPFNTTYGGTWDFRCPDESFAGLKLRFGRDVNAVGVICAARTPA